MALFDTFVELVNINKRKEIDMGLFTKKPKAPERSVFEDVSPEVQNQIVMDLTNIVRTFKKWPELMFPDPVARGKAADELKTSLRSAGMKLVSQFMMAGGDEQFVDVQDILNKLPIPPSFRIYLIAFYSTLVE